MHQGDRLFGEQYTVNVHEPRLVGSGRLWPVDPLTGDVMGQIEFTNPNSVDGWSQDQVDAVFYAMVSDLTGAPRELVDVTTGGIVGYSKQSLFGKRQWFGGKSSPLLFAGQYEDAESGWVYNRFRYYNAAFGMYNAQDPLGVGPNLASAQAYVDNPTTWVDILGLASHPKGKDPSAPHPDYPGHSNNGRFMGTNPEAVKGQDYHKQLSKELEKKGFTTGKQLPGSQGASRKGGNLIPDGQKIDKNGFITDVAEIKPDTRSGISRMKGQIKGYSDYAEGYNSALSDTTGLTAPAVAEHRIFYSPETGEISRWLS